MKKKRSTTKKKRAASRHWPWKTIVLYGQSGIGKTSVAATAPDPFFLDSNMGLTSIEGRPGLEHVRSTTITSTSKLETVYDRFTGTGRPSLEGKHKTAIFDHFDDIQAIYLEELGIKAHERDSRNLIDEVSQRAFGIMGNGLRRYVRRWKALPLHKILIVSEGMDRDTGKLQPNLIGQLRNQLPYLADLILYMRIDKKGRRVIELDGTSRYLAKCRAWWLPERRLVVPDLADDPKFLTSFLDAVVAGPRKAPSNATEKES